MTEHKDLLGYDLAVGDHVVYATGRSSSKHMCVAEILEVIDYTEDRSFYGPYDHTLKKRGERTERIIERWKVRLQPKVFNDYRSHYDYKLVDGEYKRFDKTPKAVTVERVENLVKVTLPNG